MGVLRVRNLRSGMLIFAKRDKAMKFYNWDCDRSGHMWSYETPEGAWVSRTAAQAHIARLEAALAFWMPDEGNVPDDCQATWDKHIELLPPAADRIGAVLARSESETEAEYCRKCGARTDDYPIGAYHKCS
jgi:hypothetical protein